MTALPVSIIGVPTDVGAGRRGASMGPEALRVAGITQAIARFGAEVRDCGNSPSVGMRVLSRMAGCCALCVVGNERFFFF